MTRDGRWLALLRAVNLAGDTTVRMAPLRDALAGAGFRDVRTYLQSGNVVLTSALASADAVARAVETVIEDAFGLGVDVLVRTPEEVREVLARVPFGPEAEPRRVVVHFLPEVLGPDGAAELETWDGPELVTAAGREVFVHYREGIGRSRFGRSAAYRRWLSAGTGRNLSTVRAVAGLLQDEG